jgi:hypothetical protein
MTSRERLREYIRFSAEQTRKVLYPYLLGDKGKNHGEAKEKTFGRHHPASDSSESASGSPSARA